MKRIALLGCGALSRIFAANLGTLGEGFTLASAWCRTPERREAFAGEFGCRAADSVEDLLTDRPDWVIEFAGGTALKAWGPAVLRQTSLIAVSAGALADGRVLGTLAETAAACSTKLWIASGAIGGLDVLSGFALMGRCDFRIETTKAPGSLEGAPGTVGRTLSREHPEVVFDGTPEEAIRLFPKNVNVAVASSLAAGAARPRVVLRSDPTARTTTHRIHAANAVSEVDLSFTSHPDPVNPRSSTSTAWSVLALLKNLTSPVAFF